MAGRAGIHTKALDDLYGLMRDPAVSMRVRLTSAISASRVEPLAMPGMEPPPAVAFLRNIMTYRYQGKAYRAEWRRMAGAALAYWERRAAMAQLKFNVADHDERRAEWHRILNGSIRRHLWAHHRWPQDKAALIGPDEAFEMPAHDPELGLSALLLPGERHNSRRRQTAIDEPEAPRIASEAQRRDILRDIAVVVQRRLADKSPPEAA
jgi:hypothetical protein